MVILVMLIIAISNRIEITISSTASISFFNSSLVTMFLFSMLLAKGINQAIIFVVTEYEWLRIRQTTTLQPHCNSILTGETCRVVFSLRTCKTSSVSGSNTITSLTPCDR